MSRVQSIAGPKYVIDQYQNASNLNARIRLHQLFSTNHYGWERWVFDQIRFPLQGRILELGCGTGSLWSENLDRILSGLEIVLSDFSAGMVEQAQQNLSNSRLSLEFKRIDAQSIPFEDHRFDVVIANHMLYHVPDRPKALSEIQRVLKPDGWFYTSTVGKDHLKELEDLVSRFDFPLVTWGKSGSDEFSLENGFDQLCEYFEMVSLYRYEDALIVTDPDLLTAYILSSEMELAAEQQVALAKFVENEMKANGGRLFITKDSGIFESSGIK